MKRSTRLAALTVALLLLLGPTLFAPVPVSAQAAGGTSAVSGTVLDQNGGLPIPNATVDLIGGTTRVGETKSAANGSFLFASEPAGVYHVEIRAEGYQGARTDDIFLTPGGSASNIRALLSRAATGGSGDNLREIGRVNAATGRTALSTSTTINNEVASDQVVRQGYARIGDALNTLPGVNLEGLSSSIGDSISVDIRGFNSSETQTLLDGHPIGPFGAGGGGFDFQDSPAFAIGKTQVVYGSGALGLYGTDSIGGTVDLQSLNPTRKPDILLQQGIGNMGKTLTNIQATGTYGKIGFALVHAVQGTYGPYAPGVRSQPGLVGLDISTAALNSNTYLTSGNYLLRNDLLKVRYAVTDKTTLTLDTLSATSWDDKSGNGDNCYFPYGLQLYKGQQTASNPNTYPTGANPGDPGSITCTQSIAANTNGGLACITPVQYAAATTGLAGGGPSPWQAHRDLDYHGRLTQQMGNHLITLDGFINRYTTDYNRNISGGLDPTGKFFTGGFDSTFYQTSGTLLSDDIVGRNNRFGFGYYVQHQRITGDKFGSTTNYAIQPKPEFGLGNGNFFIRNEYAPSSGNLSVFLNAWLKRSSVTKKTTFDPRLSFVYKPTNSDVIRLTGGRSDGEPSPTIVQGPPNLNLTPSNITPSCGGQTFVGNVSNLALQPESSNDLEVAYGHRFHQDTGFQVDAYASFERNRIFNGQLPVSTLGAGAIPPNLLASYFRRIQQFCGIANPTLASLAVQTNYNAASARFQGIELTGRYRLNPRLFMDYSYNVQSAVNLGVPDTILANNVTVINGSQIQSIPLHKASAALDFSDRKGLEARIDGFYLSDNNTFGRPAFFYANASITKTVGSTSFNVGVNNLFDSQSDKYLRTGTNGYIPENQFGTDTSALQQAFNGVSGTGVAGLVSPQVTFIITQHI